MIAAPRARHKEEARRLVKKLPLGALSPGRCPIEGRYREPWAPCPGAMPLAILFRPYRGLRIVERYVLCDTIAPSNAWFCLATSPNGAQ
jgi:hypothetical protein